MFCGMFIKDFKNFAGKPDHCHRRGEDPPVRPGQRDKEVTPWNNNN